MPTEKNLNKRSHVPIKLTPSRKASHPLPAAPSWTPGAHLSEGMLPEVGQAGVVPQCLCEGLCPFIPNLIAPHPESRGKQWTVTQLHLHLTSAAPLDSFSAGNSQMTLAPVTESPESSSNLEHRQADQQVVWFETSLSELCKRSTLRPSAHNYSRK